MKMYLPRETYDSVQGITDYITDLAKFCEVIDHRKEAALQGIKLNEFVLFNNLYLNPNGEIYGVFIFASPQGEAPPAIAMEFRIFRMYCDEYTLTSLPPLPVPNTFCPRCKKEPLLEDIKDFEFNGSNYFHRRCSRKPSRNRSLINLKKFLDYFS